MDKTAGNHRFGIDFRPVQTVPEDPKDRLPYFKAFKELLAGEREKIKTWHRSGAGGREIIQANTCLIDETIRQIIYSMSILERYSPFPVLEEFALIAVGGYGRGELNPFSDIDLLFLLPQKVNQTTDDFIQDVISVFWGFGMEIGHSCRTVKECISLAAEDLTIKTCMIETRFLIGDQTQYENFCASIRKSVLTKGIKKFLSAKFEERFARLGSSEGVAYDPEPDVKEGPGGLRYYHTALWAAAVRFGCLSFSEIGRKDVISNRELEILSESVDFSLRVRNELHYLKGKKADVITLDIQKDLAANLGYQAEDEVLLVKAFMRDYFLHATNIYNYSESIFERCLHAKRTLKKVLSSLIKTPLGNGFHAEGSKLTLVGDAGEIFQKDRTLLLSLFDLCREHNLEPDYQLKRQIRLHKHLLDEKFLKGESVKNFLFSILETPQSAKYLRLIHENGILGQILPEFGRAHCMVSYDFYHRYTADEHSLRMIRFLEELGSPGVDDLKDLTQVYAAAAPKPLLKFTALFQSIGTDRGSPEPQGRRELFTGIADRLGLEFHEKETLRFLIDNLYEMVETALHQDIHQPQVIQKFAQKVGTSERLDLLYLISYAELRAVAPGTWTSWKKVLLSELYHRTQLFLRRPESLEETPKATRDKVYKALHWECPASEIERHLNLMPEEYLLSSNSEEVALHIRLIRSLKDKTFILNHHYNEAGGYHHLTLCCQAKVEAFKKLLGALTSKNLNILGAQIYLKMDGIVIISIQVEGVQNSDPDDLEIWKEINKILKEVLEGKKDLRTLLASRTRYVSEKSQVKGIIPQVKIENTADSNFTVIRIEARDHLGMLYKIAATFADLGIQIHRAKISTQGERGIDVFYVSLQNRKIVFNRLIRRIKERLIQSLLSEKLEEIG